MTGIQNVTLACITEKCRNTVLRNPLEEPDLRDYGRQNLEPDPHKICEYGYKRLDNSLKSAHVPVSI